MKFISNVAAAIACLGMLVPQSVLASQARSKANTPKPTIHELVLGQGGSLRGQVVDAQNKPVAQTKIVVLAGGKQVKETTTDSDGRFEVKQLRTGLYAVGSARGFGVFRTWTATTAPADSIHAALIVEQSGAIRGQQDSILWYWLTNPWVVSLGLAALIITPIAVSNNDRSGS